MLAVKRQYVLGFDASCASCSSITQSVQQELGDCEIAILNLREKALLSARRRILGSTVPLSPTLFLLEKGEVVDAWIGVRMNLRLAKILGFQKARRLSVVIGNQADQMNRQERSFGRRTFAKWFASTGAAGFMIGMSKGGVLAQADADAVPAVSNRVTRLRRDQVLSLFNKGRERQGFSEYLSGLGYDRKTEPEVLEVTLGSEAIRTAVVETWVSSTDSSREAVIAFSREADGSERWFPRIFIPESNSVVQLFYDQAGTIQSEPEGAAPEAWPWPSWCGTCKKACEYVIKGTVAGGCFASCTAVTGGVGAAICVALCAVIYDDALVSDCPVLCDQAGAC